MDIVFFKIVSGQNDLILISFLNTPAPPLEKLIPLARALCNRRTGVGGNGVICLFKGKSHPFKLRYFRSDGEESILYNDALLCLSRYIFDSALGGPVLTVETVTGDRRLELLDSRNFRLSLGTPLNHHLSPIKPDPENDFTGTIRIQNRNFSMIPLFLGKKAAVFLNSHDSKGKRKEIIRGVRPGSGNKSPAAPVFIQIIERDKIRVKAPLDKLNPDHASSCAAGGMAAVLSGMTENEMVIRSRNTQYFFEWNSEAASVFITGSADYAFSGSFYFDEE